MESTSEVISFLPLELWTLCFSFLDARSLLKCQITCKYFQLISMSSCLWRNLCSVLSPRPLKYKKEDESWQNIYKSLWKLDFSGAWTVSTAVDPHSATYLLNYNLYTANNRDFGSRYPTETVCGFGNAPWGPFVVVGSSYGSYCCFAHIYNNTWISMYLAEIPSFDCQLMKGVWRANWQNANGAWGAIHLPSVSVRKAEKNLSQQLIDEAKMESAATDFTKIVGMWDVALASEDKPVGEISFYLALQDHKRGVDSRVVKAGLANADKVEGSFMLSSLHDEMFGSCVCFLIKGQYMHLSLVGKLCSNTSPDNALLEGRFAIRYVEALQCGYFIAKKKPQTVKTQQMGNSTTTLKRTIDQV